VGNEEDNSGRDLYAVLGLEPDATMDEIRRAFRLLAVKNHPDKNPGDVKAALRFKRINAAFQVLNDPERRNQYDELTAPIEDLALVPRVVTAPPPPPPPPEEPVVHRRRRRVVRKSKAGAWALALIPAGFLVAVFLFVPDGYRVRFGALVPAAAGSADSLVGEVPTAAQPSLATHSLPMKPVSASPAHVSTRPLPPVAASDVPTRTVTGDKWSFVLPADWRDPSDPKEHLWSAPGMVGSVRPYVKLEISTFTGEAAKYFEDLDREAPEGVVVEAESWESQTTPDGLRREGRIEGQNVRFIAYVVASKGHGYELTCSGPLDVFEAVRGGCERILRTLRIR
jgi:hypothetical protein